MAKMKIDITKVVRKAVKKTLDDTEYNGITFREWIDKITSGEYQPTKYGLTDNEMRAVLSAVNWMLIAFVGAENKEMTEIYENIRDKIMKGLGISDD